MKRTSLPEHATTDDLEGCRLLVYVSRWGLLERFSIFRFNALRGQPKSTISPPSSELKAYLGTGEAEHWLYGMDEELRRFDGVTSREHGVESILI